MAEDAPETTILKRPLWQRIVLWIGGIVAGLLILAGLLLLGLNTDPGRRFIADRLANYTTESGLKIRVGRIDGSIYGRMILNDVRVSDPQGLFLTSPRLDVDWRPFAFLNNHVDVRSLSAQFVTLIRSPALRPSTGPAGPLLPDIDIDIGHARIDRFVMLKAVTGSAHIVRIASSVHIADRRAQLTADAAALVGPGIAGGDTLKLKLDGAPDQNKLDLDVKLQAPAGGLVASMAGIHAPLVVTIGGAGDWNAWHGRAVSQLGGETLADLALTARNGDFTVKGTASPALYLRPAAVKGKAVTPEQAGPLERLTAPVVQVAIEAKLNKRSADTRVRLKSDALDVMAQGVLDLAHNTFGGFKVDARLLTPGAIAPNLKGRDVAATLTLDGPFHTPTVQYALRAAAIGFGDTVAENAQASGLARVNADRILIPVHATAKRIAGLSAAGGLLDNVAIDGDVAVQGSSILSDNLRIRSNRINATAVVAANVATGRYTGALKGTVNNYRIESFGVVNLKTDAKLVTMPGGFGITGKVAVRTQQIFNEGARSFLGGNAVMAANIGYDPKGIVTFTNVRLNAPQFRILHGSGRYDPKGPILVNADAFSTQYGPLSARVTGTLAAPVVLLKAARPGLGVGLVNVEASIKGRNGAYAVLARGGSNYGPFDSDLLVTPGKALTVDIHSATLAGVRFTGQVKQTPAGPFAGRVQFAGSGITGSALLAAQGKLQRADIDAHAYAAKIPGSVDFTIGRAIVKASVVLYPNAPQVVADAQVADLRYGAMVLSSARAKVNYVGGSGTAQAVATGSNGVPFHLALNAKLSPKLWIAALQGQASGINFKTATPARIEIGKDYRLLPTRIDFDKGSARIAGTYGAGTTLETRLDQLDLSVLNALIPDLGVGGSATGSLDFSAPTTGAFPQADARLVINNFTRSSLVAVSEPVDVVAVGKLLPSGGDLRALVKRGPTTVGRIQVGLSPIPGGDGGWSTRLMSAPLSGGIRYNGPSGVLFSLAALKNQQLSGPIAVAADFSGQLRDPRVNGVLRADNLTYDNESFGTRLSNMKLAGRFTADRLEISQMSATAGSGTVTASGSIGLAADSGFPIQLTVKLDNAQLAKSDALGATATGTIAVTNDPQNGGLIRGDLTIPQARYEIIRQGQAEVPELTGVRRKSDVVQASGPKRQPMKPFRLNIRVHADNRIDVSGMGLESEWSVDMRVGGTATAPTVTGRAEIVRGTYSFAGKRFDLDPSSAVRFEGGALADPQLSISATTTTNGISVTLNITGSGQHPQIAFTSTPTLPQDEVLSRLLFGSSVTNLSATEAIQLAAALNSLRGSGGGLNPLGKLRSATGIDRLRILGADDATGRGTSLAAGKYITNNIYIEIITDARGFTATQLQIALTKSLSILSETGTFGGSSASLKYQKDF